jgi:hypothetical protein
MSFDATNILSSRVNDDIIYANSQGSMIYILYEQFAGMTIDPSSPR